MKWTLLGLMLFAANTLAGCATSPNSFCDVASAIRPSVQDNLTQGTIGQIVKHNRFGEAQCGWRAS